MDLATLRALKLSEFEEAADGYRATGDMASAAKDRIDNQIAAAMRKALAGEAATVAMTQLRELSADFHYAQTECGLVHTALNGFAYDLQAAKRKLDAAVEDAQAAKFTVNPDGSVTYPAAGDKTDGKLPAGSTVQGTTDKTADALHRQAASIDPNPHRGPAQDIADRIIEALKEATEADEKWAPKLRALKADDDLTVSARDWADTKQDTGGVLGAAKDYLSTITPPPKDGTPQQNADWWKHLTAEQRADYIAMHPGAVGAMDGLPAETRDEANRMVLAEAHGEYATRLASIPPEPTNKYTWITAGGYPVKVHTDEWMAWDRKYGDELRHLKSSLNGMESIEKRFDSTGSQGLPEAYLLGFNPEGNGRAIIANGNPDTADHTAVYVPGTTSNLENIDGNMRRMTDLWREAHKDAHGGTVSTITWLGYDAPQDIVKDSPFSHYANDGAPAFNKFMDGLDASRSAHGEGHHTVIGHSYGTTLIGSAARQGDLNADDVIFAGSPGVQVGSASEMDVPKGHVWNEEAEGDIVPDIGRFGHGGSQWRIGGGVGIIPSDEIFGAIQMATDTEGHSGYWDEESISLKNQAQVMTGNYGNVIHED